MKFFYKSNFLLIYPLFYFKSFNIPNIPIKFFSTNSPPFFQNNNNKSFQIPKFNSHLNYQKGDWDCSRCNYHNYSFRDHCFKCGINLTEKDFIFKNNDWICSLCAKHNTNHQKKCNSCGELRISLKQSQVWICRECNYSNSITWNFCHQCCTPQHIFQLKSTIENSSFSSPLEQNNTSSIPSKSNNEQIEKKNTFIKGDWICKKCNHHNFARQKEQCHQCCEPREETKTLLPTTKNTKNKITFLNRDWICSKCSTHNFARRINCFNCKHEDELWTQRLNYKETDWTCSNCFSHNYGKNNKCKFCLETRKKQKKQIKTKNF